MPLAGDRIRAADVTRFHAAYRYDPADAQTIDDRTDTRVVLSIAEDTTPAITRSVAGDGGHIFTINRAGVWSITASYRFAAGGAAGERSGNIGSGSSALTDRWAEDNTISDGAAASGSMAADRKLAVGDTIALWVFQASGGTVDMDSLGGSNRITFTWLGESD